MPEKFLDLVLQIYQLLSESLFWIKVPQDVQNVLNFSNKAIGNIRKQKESLEKAKLELASSESILIGTVIRLTWLTLCLGRVMNNHLEDTNRKRMDFIKEATEYDREQRAS